MADPPLILVVDDEPDMRVFLEAVLEDNGYEVILASNGEQALQQVARRRPDAITLDMAMPQKSGVGVFRALKGDEATRDIPIIIVTGMANDFRRFISTRGRVPPPDGYLSKPVEEEQVLAALHEVLGRE